MFKSIYLINLRTEERWLDSFAERISNPRRSMWWRTQRQRQRRRKRRERPHRCLIDSPLLPRRAWMTFPESYPRRCRLHRRTAVEVVVGWRGGSRRRSNSQVAGNDPRGILVTVPSAKPAPSRAPSLPSQSVYSLHSNTQRAASSARPPGPLPTYTTQHSAASAWRSSSARSLD